MKVTAVKVNRSTMVSTERLGREWEICDRLLFPTAAKFAVKFVWRRTKHGGLVVQLPVKLVQT